VTGVKAQTAGTALLVVVDNESSGSHHPNYFII
jgi:hypothetical protein